MLLQKRLTPQGINCTDEFIKMISYVPHHRIFFTKRKYEYYTIKTTVFGFNFHFITNFMNMDIL